MSENCENWLVLIYNCIYYARQTREIYQGMPYSVVCVNLPESFEIYWIRQYLVNVVLYWKKGPPNIRNEKWKVVRRICKYVCGCDLQILSVCVWGGGGGGGRERGSVLFYKLWIMPCQFCEINSRPQCNTDFMFELKPEMRTCVRQCFDMPLGESQRSQYLHHKHPYVVITLSSNIPTKGCISSLKTLDMNIIGSISNTIYTPGLVTIYCLGSIHTITTHCIETIFHWISLYMHRLFLVSQERVISSLFVSLRKYVWTFLLVYILSQLGNRFLSSRYGNRWLCSSPLQQSRKCSIR